MAEESFDLEVQEESQSSEETTHGRIFAGGIELGQKDRPPFLLRVYDAVTGRFLWEGQLNLNLRERQPRGRLIADVKPLPPSMWRVDTKADARVQVYLSLRAIDPRTGRLLWQDKFVPGTSKAAGRDAVVFHNMNETAHSAPIEHVFDLVVRTFDRQSGRLLWRDSFEESDDISSLERHGDDHIEPQTAPVSTWGKSYMAKFGGTNQSPNQDGERGNWEVNSSAHCC